MPVLRTVRSVIQRAGWREVTFLAALGVFSLCVWAFLELADDAPEGDYLDLEQRILVWFRDPADLSRTIGPAWIAEIGRDVTALGGVTVISFLTLAVGGLLVLQRRARTALLVVAATFGGYAANTLLKAYFERGRPTVVPHLVEEHSLSFPSGHSMVGAAAYLTLGALCAQVLTPRREKVYVVGLAVIVAVAIGISRVYLGVHYPTDVLAGWAAGAAWAILCWGLAAWLQRRGTISTPSAIEATPPDPHGPSRARERDAP
jgi:undecaprenyl-diphosphatase